MYGLAWIFIIRLSFLRPSLLSFSRPNRSGIPIWVRLLVLADVRGDLGGLDGVLGGAVVENARGGGGPDVVLLGADALHVVGGAANLLGGVIGAGLL